LEDLNACESGNFLIAVSFLCAFTFVMQDNGPSIYLIQTRTSADRARLAQRLSYHLAAQNWSNPAGTEAISCKTSVVDSIAKSDSFFIGENPRLFMGAILIARKF
jgi:hypothetical protein